MYLRSDSISMKVSYSWLKDYLHFDASPQRLADILTNIGLEVEGIEKVGPVEGGLEGVVTGKVKSCEKHPDADKLKVTRVDVGDETLQIVCGASNVAVGQIVLVARAGATIHPIHGEPITLRKAKIRGIESNGMICAEDELGIGTSHEGILILPDKTPAGISASEALNIEQDYILEIGLTPNRCDALGHFGVARDLRAFLNHHESRQLSLHIPEITLPKADLKNSIKGTVAKETACSAYYLAFMKGVKVTKTKSTVSRKLRSIGLSSVNNVVDCANFVMHEFGTPLHAFDARFFQSELRVRMAEVGEELVTLDGLQRKLTAHDVVIAGDGKAHCLAGVMGGKDSGVGLETVDLVIESAIFDPSKIRKTAKYHGLHSDASFRFERGVDPDLTLLALQRVVGLILENAGGTFEGITEVCNNPEKSEVITFDLSYINQIIGSNLNYSAIEKILESLDIRNLKNGSWELPRYRSDVKRPIDVVEEVLRIAGFNSIPELKKWSFSIPYEQGISPNRFRHKLAHTLASKGFSEILNNSLTKNRYDELPLEKEAGRAIILKNPLSRDLSILRNSIFYGMLETVAYNRNRQAPNLKLFEFGQTYHAQSDRHFERSVLGICITGTYQAESWLGSRAFTFFDLKGHVLDTCQSYGEQAILEEAFENEGPFEQGIHLFIKGKKIASLGLIAANWLKTFDLKQTIYAAQIDVNYLHEIAVEQKVMFQELPKTFQVRRDFALVVDQAITYTDIVQEAFKAASKRLVKCSLFDVYIGNKIEPDKKSYAVAFHFRDNHKTLTDSEIDAEMESIRLHLEATLKTSLR
ncbi:MAG: phenylalanine--tRNA ligase subunit beta [Bacteroidetes bacterium]|nr:phenylalanine--tRNA ligase subunit beta [Bacteroidota bacterium]